MEQRVPNAAVEQYKREMLAQSRKGAPPPAVHTESRSKATGSEDSQKSPQVKEESHFRQGETGATMAAETVKEHLTELVEKTGEFVKHAGTAIAETVKEVAPVVQKAEELLKAGKTVAAEAIAGAVAVPIEAAQVIGEAIVHDLAEAVKNDAKQVLEAGVAGAAGVLAAGVEGVKQGVQRVEQEIQKKQAQAFQNGAETVVRGARFPAQEKPGAGFPVVELEQRTVQFEVTERSPLATTRPINIQPIIIRPLTDATRTTSSAFHPPTQEPVQGVAPLVQNEPPTRPVQPLTRFPVPMDGTFAQPFPVQPFPVQQEHPFALADTVPERPRVGAVPVPFPEFQTPATLPAPYPPEVQKNAPSAGFSAEKSPSEIDLAGPSERGKPSCSGRGGRPPYARGVKSPYNYGKWLRTEAATGGDALRRVSSEARSSGLDAEIPQAPDVFLSPAWEDVQPSGFGPDQQRASGVFPDDDRSPDGTSENTSYTEAEAKDLAAFYAPATETLFGTQEPLPKVAYEANVGQTESTGETEELPLQKFSTLEDFLAQNQSAGYLTLHVSDAATGRPVENAELQITKRIGPTRYSFQEVRTDAQGNARQLVLPTPLPDLSYTPPDGTLPYAMYDVTVFGRGAAAGEEQELQNVSIFAGTESVQNVLLQAGAAPLDEAAYTR